MKNIPSFTEYVNEAATDTSQFDEIIKALPKLEQLIQREVGFRPKLTARVQKGRMGNYLDITSEDVRKHMGSIGPAIFKSAVIHLQGGGDVMTDGSGTFTCHLQYEVPYGGSNGVKFVWDGVWYSFDEFNWIPGRKIA
jgi:hypothetical protein